MKTEKDLKEKVQILADRLQSLLPLVDIFVNNISDEDFELLETAKDGLKDKINYGNSASVLIMALGGNYDDTEDRIEEKYTRYLNCETDTLELTIEEAIYILEKDASFHYVEDLLQEAYKVILSDYKRTLKENEELEEINNELEAEKNEAIRRYNFETIPKQKVKDKIEELENYIQENSDEQGYWGNINPDVIYAQTTILEEILEESEE